MKKVFKIIALAPILLILMLCSIACACTSTPKLESITLSIQGQEDNYSNGYYNIKKNNAGYIINTELSSSEFDVYDLTWKSSNTNVATVYYNKLKTVGIGETTITATYKNADGSEVKGKIKVNIDAESLLITFPQGSETTYNGEDQKNLKIFRAVGDTGSGEYLYSYYDYSTSQLLQENNAELKNAGRYKIICTSATDSNIQTTKDITIKKHTLSFTAKNFDPISYGDNLPNYNNNNKIPLKESLFNIENKPTDEVILSGANNEIIGLSNDGVIGKYIYTTSAKKGSNVKTYDTSIYFVLDDSNKMVQRNYNAEANITNGSINIIAKNVQIVLDDQTIVYGSSALKNKYALYDINSAEKINLLNDSDVDYASNIVLGADTYKIEKTVGQTSTYQSVNLNSSGVLDVRYDVDGETILPYKLFYENATTKSGNVVINEIVAGNILVNRKPVKVEPNAGQSKVYGTADPQKIDYTKTEGSFLPKDEINLKPFIYIDYSGISVDNADTDVDKTINPNYDYNLNAQYGSYYYKIDNRQNKNYDIALSAKAIDDGSPIENKVAFKVTKSRVSLKVNSIEQNYQKPKGAGGEFAVSYFTKGNSAYNFETNISSFIVNGSELVTYNTSDNSYTINNQYLGKTFNEDGLLQLVVNKTPNSQTATYMTLATLRLTLVLTKLEEEGNFFAKYKMGINVTFDSGDAVNYDIIVDKNATVTLNKITLIVTPNQTESLFSKTYDATNDIVSAGFGSDYALSDKSINISDILDGSDTNLLTMIDRDGLYHKEGFASPVADMISVGRYEVMLKDYKLKSDYEHFNIVLDNSQKYYYTVKPRQVVVVPEVGQFKIYGSDDNAFAYTIQGLPNNVEYDPAKDANTITNQNGDNVTIQGSLVRAAGENVGNYAITLGNLYFGSNYTIVLDETVVNYAIMPRKVTITPISYSLRYGDEEPTKPSFYEEIDKSVNYNPNILIAPSYNMLNFVLKNDISDVDTVKKIGGYTPVRVDASGYVQSYIVCQGDFNISNNNYQIEFVSTSTYTVNPREVVINLNAKERSASESIVTENLGEIDKTKYTVLNLIDNPIYSLRILKLTLNDSKNAYYLGDTAADFTFTLQKDGQDITHCYKVTVGRNVFYTIGVAFVELAIVDLSLKTSTVEIVYSGNEFSNGNNEYFTLVSQTEGFEVQSSTFGLSYSSLMGGAGNPKNAGSYRVSIDENSPINIKVEKTDPNTHAKEIIEFTSLSTEQVVDNYVISISNVAYLNITKADISYNRKYLSFDYGVEQGLEYGSEGLPTLLEQTIDPASGNLINIFSGVNGENITLKTYEDAIANKTLNYKLTLQSQYEDYKKYDANEKHPLNVMVEATSNNYKPLYIDVMLNITPKKVNYSNLVYYLLNKGQSLEEKQIIYNGYTTTASLALMDDKDNEVTNSNISTLNRYYKIETVYNGTRAEYAFKTWDSATSTLGNTVQYESYDETYFAKKSMTLYSDNSYVIVGDRALMICEGGEVSPTDAGFYICITTISINSNYTFYDTQNNKNNGQILLAGCFYEIKKSDNINVTWIETDNVFKYTTAFDFSDVESLEFVYTIPSAFKNDVYFENLRDGKGVYDMPTDKVLNINNYIVDFIIETNNYYVKKEVKFQVIALPAEIILPSVTSYVYTQQPIISFLDDIGAVLKNKYGYVENTVYYTPDNTDFKFEIEEVEGDNLDSSGNIYSVDNMPTESGDYKLTVVYGNETDSNYYGTNTFNYSIINRTFTGSITFKNAEMSYNPSFNHTNVFNSVKGSMFNISDTSIEYNLELYWVEGSNNYVLIDHDYSVVPTKWYIEQEYGYTVSLMSKQQEDFKRFFTYGQKTLKLIVNFADKEYLQDREMSAILTISKYNLASGNFAYANNSNTYYYNGYNVSHHLKFSGVDMLPNVSGDKTPIVGQGALEKDGYKYTFKTADAGLSNRYIVTVKDRLDNLVFELTYVYSIYDTVNAVSVMNCEMPVVPDEDNRDYRVEYKFSFGGNYNGSNVTYRFKTFSIEKVDLYIGYNTKFATSYDGANCNNYVENLKNRVIVTNTDTSNSTNMKVKYDIGSSQNGYNVNDGVRLRIYLANQNSETPITSFDSLTVVGNYNLCVSLSCSSDYDLTKYFKSIKFYNKDTVDVESFKNSIEDEEYSNRIAIPVEITKANSIYGVSNYLEVLTFTNANVTIENGRLNIEKSTKIESIKVTGYKLHIVDTYTGSVIANNITVGYSFDELSTDDNRYQIRIEDTYGNYLEGFINIKIIENYSTGE